MVSIVPLHGRGKARRALAHCEDGDVAVEYVVLLGTIAIPLLPVLVAFGVWIVGLFENFRNLALLPFP